MIGQSANDSDAVKIHRRRETAGLKGLKIDWIVSSVSIQEVSWCQEAPSVSWFRLGKRSKVIIRIGNIGEDKRPSEGKEKRLISQMYNPTRTLVSNNLLDIFTGPSANSKCRTRRHEYVLASLNLVDLRLFAN